MQKTINAYGRTGNNVVVDYILYDKGWFKELIKEREGLKVYYIGIKYPIETIEERKRATSPVGHAKSHYKEVHFFGNYNLMISDPKLSDQDIALKIRPFIKNNPNLKSFLNYSK